MNIRFCLCKEEEFSSPNYGYCASQKKHFYGYKLHNVISLSGVVQSFDISPASVHDIHFLKDIREQMSNCTLIGDKGYFSQLCDQFMLKRNYAKTFEGFKTRIISKITAGTIVQYINKFIFDRNINNLKVSII